MSTATALIDEIGLLLGDDSHSLITEHNKLTFLMRAISDIMNRSRSIVRGVYAAKIAGTFQYALPDEFLSARMVLFSQDGGSTWYPLKRGHLRDMYNERYYLKTSSSPSHYTITGRGRTKRAEGTATGGSSTQLADTGVNFTALGVKVGDIVFNNTDDSEAVVTTVGTTTVDFSGGLAGGADDAFAAADTYLIVSQVSPLHVVMIHPAPAANEDATGEESIQVLASMKHNTITTAEYDAGIDELEIDAEFEPAVIHRTLFWLRKRMQDQDGANNEFILYNTEYARAWPKVKSRMDEYISGWSSQVARVLPEITTDVTYSYPLGAAGTVIR